MLTSGTRAVWPLFRNTGTPHPTAFAGIVFASLDPLSLSGQALYSQPHSLLAGFIPMALTTASGLVALLACPPPQTSSVLAHLAHCHVPCAPERNDTGKSPVRAGGGGGVNENHLASHLPCEVLTPKPGAGGGFHGPLPAFPDSNLFQANPPQMLPLPAPCCPCCWVLGQGDLWGIHSG